LTLIVSGNKNLEWGKRAIVVKKPRPTCVRVDMAYLSIMVKSPTGSDRDLCDFRNGRQGSRRLVDGAGALMACMGATNVNIN
jgi:hypothetical protein